MDREDGEMSDDNAMLVDDDAKESIEETKRNCTVLYRAEKNGLVIKQLEKVDAVKLEERANRFGLNLTGNRIITQNQIDELYENLGIESGNERHFRFDSIHLSGVDGLTTREIFQYLEDYKPLSLEWIDNISCNVVCQDHISAALALLAHSCEIKSEDLKSMLADKSTYHWREGVPHPRKDLILMRFATNADKKMVKKKPETKNVDVYYDQSMDSVSKNPWGDLCKSWGVYDHQEVFQRKLPKNDYEDDTEDTERTVPKINKRLAMRLGKRSFNTRNSENTEDSSSDLEWKSKSKTPRMRMHADDEEKKQKKKHVAEMPKIEHTDKYAPLSIEVVNSQRNLQLRQFSSNSQRETTKLSDKFKYFKVKQEKHGIKSRLGDKIEPENDTRSSDEDSSENSDCNVMSKVQKVGSKTKSTSNVWSRLEIKPNNSSVPDDLRQIIKSRKQKKPDDLRGRIGKSKQSNLRIEIDNNYASD